MSTTVCLICHLFHLFYPKTQQLTSPSLPTLECLEHTSHRRSYYCAPNDVWSLGVILVNLTCGRNPWKQASFEDSTYRAYLRNPEFLKTILPVSDELNDILVRIFTRDPALRITMPELMEAIRTCPRFTCQAPPAQAVPTPVPSAQEPISPPSTPPPAESVYVSGLVSDNISVMPGITFATIAPHPSPASYPPSPPSSTSSSPSSSRSSSPDLDDTYFSGPSPQYLNADDLDGVEREDRPDVLMNDTMYQPKASLGPLQPEYQGFVDYAPQPQMFSQPHTRHIISQPTHTIMSPSSVSVQPSNGAQNSWSFSMPSLPGIKLFNPTHQFAFFHPIS